MLVYLTSSEAGETDFPALGIRVQPMKGRALVFENTGSDGLCSALTAHSALPTESGSRKLVLQKWVYRDGYKRKDKFDPASKRMSGQITCDEVDCRWYERLGGR